MCGEEQDHLSRISTLWEPLLQTYGADTQAARAAQAEILQRYAGPVHRYLRKVLGDADAADEVFQEFALGLVRGDFRHADPRKGRFRDYLKISLLRLVSAYRRRCVRRRPNGQDVAVPHNGETGALPADDFAAAFREDFLLRAWDRLRELEQRSGQPFFTVLDFRARHPERTSEQMAQALAGQLADGPLNAAAVRKTLERARAKYADILLDEVAAALGSGDREALETEIIELGLHRYCRGALARRFA
jgi:RNA polymerase sigma-70 factor (ECF subfamily)